MRQVWNVHAHLWLIPWKEVQQWRRKWAHRWQESKKPRHKRGLCWPRVALAMTVFWTLGLAQPKVRRLADKENHYYKLICKKETIPLKLNQPLIICKGLPAAKKSVFYKSFENKQQYWRSRVSRYVFTVFKDQIDKKIQLCYTFFIATF